MIEVRFAFIIRLLLIVTNIQFLRLMMAMIEMKMKYLNWKMDLKVQDKIKKWTMTKKWTRTESLLRMRIKNVAPVPIFSSK